MESNALLNEATAPHSAAVKIRGELFALDAPSVYGVAAILRV
jgi:hypothetical protein